MVAAPGGEAWSRCSLRPGIRGFIEDGDVFGVKVVEIELPIGGCGACCHVGKGSIYVPRTASWGARTTRHAGRMAPNEFNKMDGIQNLIVEAVIGAVAGR